MEFSERDLQEYLLKNNTIQISGAEVQLIDSEVNINGYKIDLLGVDVNDNIYIFELKKGIIDGNALSQVLNYVYYAKKFTEEKKLKVFGVLVGSGINQYTYNAISILPDILFVGIELGFNINDIHYKDVLDLGNEYVYNSKCDFLDKLDGWIELEIPDMEEINNGKKKND